MKMRYKQTRISVLDINPMTGLGRTRKIRRDEGILNKAATDVPFLFRRKEVRQLPNFLSGQGCITVGS